MSFIILIAAGLIVPIFYRSNIVIAKLIAVIAFLLSAYFIYVGNSLNSIFPFFAVDKATMIMEFVLLATLAAVTLALTGFERPLIAQMLFLAGASLAFVETNNFFLYIVLFEVIAIISYILVANIRNFYNAEGAIKAFIAGAVASGVILLGFALYSFVTDSFIYSEMNVGGKYTLIAVAIMLAGIFYKLTVVPMHGWAADAYSQVNHAAAAILSGVIKSVVLFATFKAFYKFFVEYPTATILIFSFFAIITMTLANFMALWQKRISKILAYSSIAHSGYALIPFAAAASAYSYAGVLYYAVAYIFMQTSVFLILNDLRRELGVKYLEDIKGLYKKAPLHSLLFTIQIFSLAGIPLLAGFLSKAVAFYAGIDVGLWPIVLVALLNSALAVGYYVWIIKHIYFDEPKSSETISMSFGSLLGQLILLAGTIYFGIIATDIISATTM
ncbi:NADH-quinone oxidoreductase subunit N [Caminibacter mediatlanticus TB-2]|uniref:NADH-quinone oxidoreductase subunit N n=1 Tax=Caminibacter mediatlanticus TB-2 TaxID=391592 RepID=A0ABX5VB90_9BACT|nr:proton-conducting transporter membrane subunit [Caminibacter mediatlanticus]QCT94164.1 NADH-quinone oxidoreductase subunit N [Caminibacter mediatlanticus TB-2]